MVIYHVVGSILPSIWRGFTGAPVMTGSGSQAAKRVLVLCQTDKSKGPKGLALIAVERGTPGFTSKDLVGKLGFRAGNPADLRFSDCGVPEENLIGEVGVRGNMFPVSGAYGLMDEYPIQHHHRDALTTHMMGGMQEMHALTIGR